MAPASWLSATYVGVLFFWGKSMKVKQLIAQLLECNMEDEIFIFVNNKTAHSEVYKVHIGSSESYRDTGTFNPVIEAIDDLEFRKD